MKVCPKCHLLLPLADFYRAKKSCDGHAGYCKTCSKETRTVWGIANPEKIKAFAAFWRAANTERHKATSAAWRATNPERAAANVRAWQVANPEKVKTNRAAWFAANPVKVRVHRKRRRNLLKQVECTLTADEWLATIGCFNNRCAYCLTKSGSLEMDHMIPVSKGGGSTQENIVPACKKCNRRKSNKPIWTMLPMPEIRKPEQK